MSAVAMAARLCVGTMAVSLAAACTVAPYGAQVYLARVQQNYVEVVQRCEAGDSVACGIRPFEAKAVAQAQEEAYLPWR